jgi:hypothetical protein
MLLLNAAAENTMGPTFGIPAAGNLEDMTHTLFLSGVLGATPATVQVQYSPDPFYRASTGPGSVASGTPDTSSRWFNGPDITTTNSYLTITDIFRKIRASVVGGDGTTSLTLELVGP